MEQQNKLTEEEKAYQALRTQDMQDMPDLWSRIDTGFEEEVTKQQAARKKRRTRQFVLVAAAILIVIIAVPVGISSMRKSNMKEMKTETAADMHVTEAGKDEWQMRQIVHCRTLQIRQCRQTAKFRKAQMRA